MDERERLLAEGPRVAPEPGAAPDRSTTSSTRRRPSPSPRPSSAGSKWTGRPFARRHVGRLIPVTVLGLTLLAQAGRQGAYVAAAVGAIVLATVAVLLVRKATR